MLIFQPLTSTLLFITHYTSLTNTKVLYENKNAPGTHQSPCHSMSGRQNISLYNNLVSALARSAHQARLGRSARLGLAWLVSGRLASGSAQGLGSSRLASAWLGWAPPGPGRPGSSRASSAQLGLPVLSNKSQC